jgi:hypothetical protein
VASPDPRRYLFFVRAELPGPEAHLIQPVQCAAAAANVGYDTCLAYLDRSPRAWQLHRWVRPRPRSIDAEFAHFFHIQPPPHPAALAMPWPTGSAAPPAHQLQYPCL